MNIVHFEELIASLKAHGETDLSVGICIRDGLIPDPTQDDWLKDRMKAWAYFSGMVTYPIKVNSSYAPDKASTQYSQVITRNVRGPWGKEYIALRRNLLEFLIEEAQTDLHNLKAL